MFYKFSGPNGSKCVSPFTLPDQVQPNLTGSYVVKYNADTDQLYLCEHKLADLPPKIYGKKNKLRAKRYFDSFESRPGRVTGVLLTGESGAGKSILMTMIAHDAISKDIPVITITNEVMTEDLIPKVVSFIHSGCASQSAVLLMDEFEKMIDHNNAAIYSQLLSIFDGTSASHKFIVCSANSNTNIGQHFFRRTGRFRYVATYGTMDVEDIREYVDDKIADIQLREEVFQYAKQIDRLNMDCLCALVDEVLVTGSINEAIADLNIFDISSNSVYRVESLYNTMSKETRLVKQTTHDTNTRYNTYLEYVDEEFEDDDTPSIVNGREPVLTTGDGKCVFATNNPHWVAIATKIESKSITSMMSVF